MMNLPTPTKKYRLAFLYGNSNPYYIESDLDLSKILYVNNSARTSTAYLILNLTDEITSDNTKIYKASYSYSTTWDEVALTSLNMSIGSSGTVYLCYCNFDLYGGDRDNKGTNIYFPNMDNFDFNTVFIADFNLATDRKYYKVSCIDYYVGKISNSPVTSDINGLLENTQLNGKLIQTFTNFNGDSYKRSYDLGVWTEWSKVESISKDEIDRLETKIDQNLVELGVKVDNTLQLVENSIATYPRLDTEPENVIEGYQYGDIRRYGAVSYDEDKTVNINTSLKLALDNNGSAFIPRGRWVLNAPNLNYKLPNASKIYGEGKDLTYILMATHASEIQLGKDLKISNLTMRPINDTGYFHSWFKSFKTNTDIGTTIIENVDFVSCNSVFNTGVYDCTGNVTFKNVDVYSLPTLTQASVNDSTKIDVSYTNNFKLDIVECNFRNGGYFVKVFNESKVSSPLPSQVNIVDSKFSLSSSQHIYSSGTKNAFKINVSDCYFEDGTSVWHSYGGDNKCVVNFNNCIFKNQTASTFETTKWDLTVSNSMFINAPIGMIDGVSIDNRFFGITTQTEGGVNVVDNRYPTSISYAPLPSEASLTTLNIIYPYGDIRRYGGVKYDSTNNKATINDAFKSALNSVGFVYLPQGEYYLDSRNISYTLPVGAKIFGDGKDLTKVRLTNGYASTLKANTDMAIRDITFVPFDDTYYIYSILAPISNNTEFGNSIIENVDFVNSYNLLADSNSYNKHGVLTFKNVKSYVKSDCTYSSASIGRKIVLKTKTTTDFTLNLINCDIRNCDYVLEFMAYSSNSSVNHNINIENCNFEGTSYPLHFTSNSYNVNVNMKDTVVKGGKIGIYNGTVKDTLIAEIKDCIFMDQTTSSINKATWNMTVSDTKFKNTPLAMGSGTSINNKFINVTTECSDGVVVIDNKQTISEAEINEIINSLA